MQPDLVDKEALRELLALFYRYHIDKSRLAVLVRPEHSSWFYDKEKYWNSDYPVARIDEV